ncbi:hypothetical protein KAFR_0B05000 [Kazachstania africana CBS 2517]|uniref:Ribophorin II C-terminal domain-containing protein n=1 Tax=Kazachstania africana (strain ATCC 22294 / BCRC 22015 / CBS 2517 / CECT 1963 / NBRC 1671 / NRRL Y-8276) TaxID=1071382 RepID=H2AQZ6_KAZAF|nr:hypothetical protein KAFR_0B05000 [Kazachstania africana CBS 2517]CCF56796.1 hypothetical protein KAFR_0B05000 [Kazachstania africana CBS 2517]
MKLINSIIILFTLFCYSLASISIKDTKISFSKYSDLEPIKLGDFDSKHALKESAPILIDRLNETISLSFKLNQESANQLALLVGNDKTESYISLEPKKSKKSNKDNIIIFRLKISNLPNSLLESSILSNEKLSLHLIIANGSKDKLFNKITELDLSNIVGYEPIENEFKFRKELSHTFPEDHKTVAPFIAQLFMLATVFTVLCLFFSWFNFNAISFENLSQVSTLYFAIFIGSIVSTEYVFTMYYIGSSIFTTLHYMFYVAIVGILFGTKFLRTSKSIV